jgi:hypothetical protein
MLTATPHKGDPVNFSLFLQLLDPEPCCQRRSVARGKFQEESTDEKICTEWL